MISAVSPLLEMAMMTSLAVTIPRSRAVLRPGEGTGPEFGTGQGGDDLTPHQPRFPDAGHHDPPFTGQEEFHRAGEFSSSRRASPEPLRLRSG